METKIENESEEVDVMMSGTSTSHLVWQRYVIAAFSAVGA